jgi:hypothetical protein
MFEGLFPDADKLNLEEMQRRLDEQRAHSEKNSQSSLGERNGAISQPARRVLARLAIVARTHFGSVPAIAGSADAGINDKEVLLSDASEVGSKTFCVQSMFSDGHGSF